MIEELQYSFNGLTFGDGCDIMVNRASGFEGFDARSSDMDLPRGDGAIRGEDYAAPRIVSFELVAWEPDLDGSLYESLWTQIRNAFALRRSDDAELLFRRPGEAEKMIRCRPVQLDRVENWKTFNRYGYPPVTLRAVDPRIYSAEQYTLPIPIFANSQTGIDLPIVEFPLDIAAPTQTEAVVQNDGNANAYPLIRVYGPTSGTCTGFSVSNTTTGQSLIVGTSIGTNQILSADMEAAVTGADRLVVSIDNASRYGSWVLPREPFALAPGSNTLRFQPSGTGTDTKCLVTWHSTWMD